MHSAHARPTQARSVDHDAPGGAPVRTHTHDLAPFRHSHAFADGAIEARMRALLWVTALTLVTMAVELAAGWWSGSLALVADGWHMGTHAAALGGAALAYHLARRAEGRSRYAFGGWKIEVLAGYSSGLLLLGVALALVVEAISTLMTPHAIDFRDALVIAVIGLFVNLASAVVLARAGAPHGHHHGPPGTGDGTRQAPGHGPLHGDAAHDHGHATHPASHPGQPPDARHAAAHAHDKAHAHAHAHAHDHNFHAAYLHVLADALTSVLAIGALAGGLWLGWWWLDPAVALVGAAVIGAWAIGLVRGSARALVDATADDSLRAGVKAAIESDGDATLADLHVWQVGPQAWSAALSVVADRPQSCEVYRARLAPLAHIRHATIEVHRCRGTAHP
jgi:cation diffusion facilitator family transporter